MMYLSLFGAMGFQFLKKSLFLSKICDINRKIPYENNKWNTQKWHMGTSLKNGESENYGLQFC